MEISLDAIPADQQCQPIVRVNVKVDWHEKHKFLKFALPLDVHCAYATYGTQFGVIERPTHRNTMIDQAKFEVCAHGFADVSEATYGVAIASRDKYGYVVEGNVMRLSLVRAPTSPDPETDQGHHDIDFAIIPHYGQLAASAVQHEALKFNNRPYVVRGLLHEQMPRFTVTGSDASAIQLETIKRGEDDKEGIMSLVLRMHESFGGRARGQLHITGIKIKSAQWVNILEEEMVSEGEVQYEQNENGLTVPLSLRHFEIRTLKLIL